MTSGPPAGLAGVLCVAVILFFVTLHKAKKEKTYQGSVPLVVFGAIAAAIIAGLMSFKLVKA
mgnify:CR=1 FL=1